MASTSGSQLLVRPECLPAPFALLISSQEYTSFEQECARSMSSDLWICGRCGTSSFGLERASAARLSLYTRPCNWRTAFRDELSTCHLKVNPHLHESAR
jgi:hypothetical protein